MRIAGHDDKPAKFSDGVGVRCGDGLGKPAFLHHVADAAAPVAPHFGIVVVLFLRGGMDGLNFIAPAADANYIAARPPELRVLPDGDSAGLPLANGPAGLDFRMHPAAKPLKDLYDSGQLAVIHAAGLTHAVKNHEQAASLLERGLGEIDDKKITTGWLTRHLPQAQDAGVIPAVTPCEILPASLQGSSAVVIPDVSNFAFSGDDTQLALIESLYAGDGKIHRAGTAALSAMKVIKEKLPKNEKGEIQPYQPADGANYPGGDLAGSFQQLARLIKMDVGLNTATLDFGGWDTHHNQPGIFPGLLDQLSNALNSFYNDMNGFHERLTIIVMSEFGRSLKPNDSGGTEHGHGNVMMALGGSVNGGQIYGKWPGLAEKQLNASGDLAVTTDYRTVLSELLVRRFGETKLSTVFPGVKAYQPLGIFKGADFKTDLG